MYNKFMDEKELNVKVGDRVTSHGYKGTVTEVYKTIKHNWNRIDRRYEEIPGTESTSVKIHFDEDSELIRNGYMQFQDVVYGEFYVI